MRTIQKTATEHVETDGLWVFVDKVKFGFRMKDTSGVNRLVVHKRFLEKHAEEYGFLVPTALAGMPMLFELRIEDTYTHYFYEPRKKNRIIKSGQNIFLGIGRMEQFTKATHIKKVSVK